MSRRYRCWCFTLNNYTDAEWAKIYISEPRYYIFGVEKGKKKETPHLQGYIEFYRPMRISEIKTFLGVDRLHLEKRRGTQEEAIEYCKKEGEYIEYGTPAQQGQRVDIDDIKYLVAMGGNMRDVIDIARNYQDLKIGQILLQNQPKPLPVDKKVYWYWGDSGTGKTYHAIEECGGYAGDWWMSSRSLKWWDGYNGQESVIIDDFRGDFCTFHELLRILDKTPFRCDIKGSSAYVTADKIIITSCYHPKDVYKTNENKYQLLRRINKIVHFSKKYVGTEVEVGNTELPPTCIEEEFN